MVAMYEKYIYSLLGLYHDYAYIGTVQNEV